METVDKDVVFQKALHILSLREHSMEELRRKLVMRGFPGEIINSVLSKLTRARLLDDARFSAAFVREKVKYKQMGRKGLFSELRKRGVGEDIAGSAITDVMEEEGVNEKDLALRVMERKRGSQRKKIEALLRRRGFNEYIIREILTDRNNDL